eukprot:TRINITY_DN68181_c0_g1_i1.p1 TRINITY_DN68181_c0_g1~~TRINITY_DN68181_c0_g1_i1.p1  ORF type:complete len:367 (-),score=72.01 TRINITY_DN68181_c0_g1_i1:1376-2476(-)
MTLNLVYFPGVPTPNLLYVSFNQTFECFAVGLTTGFRIYNCNPFGEAGRKDFDGGIGIVEMLYRSNILALVGDGKNPNFPTHQVVIWDDRESQSLAEVAFQKPVRAVKLQKATLIVAIETDVFLYNLEDLQNPAKFTTVRNNRGILAVSPSLTNPFLVCPSDEKGRLRVQRVGAAHRHIVHANDSGIACVGISADGRLVGVASSKGTIIRIFAVESGAKVRELRRGTSPADVHSISFSADGRLVLCTSDRGTLHVWALPQISDGAAGAAGGDAPPPAASPAATASAAQPHNKKSVLSVLGGMSPYFASEWSSARWSGPDYPSVAGFSPQSDAIYVVAADATFYHLGVEQLANGELQVVLRRGPCNI